MVCFVGQMSTLYSISPHGISRRKIPKPQKQSIISPLRSRKMSRQDGRYGDRGFPFNYGHALYGHPGDFPESMPVCFMPMHMPGTFPSGPCWTAPPFSDRPSRAASVHEHEDRDNTRHNNRLNKTSTDDDTSGRRKAQAAAIVHPHGHAAGRVIHHIPSSSSSSSARPPNVAFKDAAERFEPILQNALPFFTEFYSNFNKSTKAIKQHADQKLLDAIWKSQLEYSRKSPGETGPVVKNPNDNNDDNDGDAEGEKWSFHDLQRDIVEVAQQLCHASIPSSRSQSPNQPPGTSRTSDAEAADNDDELYAKKHRAKEKLRTEMNKCIDTLKDSMLGMTESYLTAQKAISELKKVQTHVTTYKQESGV